MRWLKAALLAALALTSFARPALAEGGGMFFGTNFGVMNYSPEDGDGLVAVTWPSQSGIFLPVFQPGLRIGGFLDADRRQALFLDTGMGFVSTNGNSLMNLQALVGYQHAFSSAPSAPFVDLGVGVMHLGDEDESYNAMVIGGGVGVRRSIAQGHGAVRIEFHVDRQFEVEDGGDVVFPAFTALGLKVGLDLHLK